MALAREHDLHRRRRGRNVALGVVLVLFVALVFGLSIVKIEQGDMMEAFDHQPRASALPPAGDALADPGPAPAAPLDPPGPAPEVAR